MVTLTVHHRRATEAYKNSMVPLFTREVYLTSLTTGQSFRKQYSWLKQNSFQCTYLPHGKIWSRNFLLNVIQHSPTQETKHKYVFFDTCLVPASCSLLKPYDSCLKAFPPLFFLAHLYCRASYIFVMWVRPVNPGRWMNLTKIKHNSMRFQHTITRLHIASYWQNNG